MTVSAPSHPADHPSFAGRAIRLLLFGSFLWTLCFTALPAAPATAAAAAPTPITTGVPRFEAGPCVYTLAEGQTEGKTVSCGTVVVAAKHNNPTGPTIRIPVAVYKAISATPAAEATILLTGGPGQSGQIFNTVMENSAQASAFYKGTAANNDVIVFDQRGTGKSEPSLVCAEMSGMITKSLYLQAFADSPFVTAMARCRDDLAKKGVDFSAYTTTENAADVNDIRIALGYPALNVVGGSYGSALGLAVIRDYSKYVRSNSIVSIAPLQSAWFFEPPQSFHHSLTAFFADCASKADCNAAYPNLQAAYQGTVATLNKAPYPLKVKDPASGQIVTVPLDGDTYTNLLFQFFYASSIIPFMPDMITRSAQMNFVWLENILPQFLESENEDPIAMGMHFSIVCSADPSKARLDAAIEADKSVLPEVRAALEPQSIDYYTICQSWPSLNADMKSTTAVVSDAPTVLINGQFDPITPPNYGALAKETLSNAVNVTLPGGGHSAILPFDPVGTCGFAITITNIANPGKPDTSCTSALVTTYRALPPAIGGPAPSPTPSPSPSASPVPTPSPMPSSSPIPSPPPTGNGGVLPGLPNTGDGGSTGGNSGGSANWLIVLPFLALAAIGVAPARRLIRRYAR